MKKYKNYEMDAMLISLKPLLSHRGKLGYAAARNARILSNALVEYYNFRNELIKKYGEKIKDDNGSETMGININSPNFDIFTKEMEEYMYIEHNVDLMTVSYTDAMEVLTGEEMLNLDWMLNEH